MLNGIIRTDVIKNVPAMRLTSGYVTTAHGGAMMFGILSRKKCSTCGKKKSRGEFSKSKSHKDGLEPRCKMCNSKRAKEWAKNNPSRKSKTTKEWRENNKERHAENTANWIASNAEHLRAYWKQWYLENKEKKLSQAQERYVQKKDEILEKKRLQRTPDVVREMNKKWYLSNKDKALENNRNRRAFKKVGGGKVTAKEWKDLCEKYGNKCLCCGASGIKLTQDHVLPLVLFGKHSIENIQPLCQSCNSKKGTKVIDYR